MHTGVLKVLVILAGPFVMCGLEPAVRAGESAPGVAGIGAAIENIRGGDASKGTALRGLGKEGIPELLKFADDKDSQVRYSVVLALGESDDDRVIPVLLERLEDVDRNVRAASIDALSRMPVKSLERQSRAALLLLGSFASRWDEGSFRAVLLLGKLGGQPEADLLRKILSEARISAKDPADDRHVLAPGMTAACLKALVRLDDAEAIRSVLVLLKNQDVSDRVLGIECIAFAGRSELARELAPLLDDTRDALNIAPSGGKYYLRVRDLAVDAIVQTSGLRPSFQPRSKGTRYTDIQVAELRALMAAIPDKQERPLSPKQ